MADGQTHKPKRNRINLKARLTPCECCRHFLSQRHHAIPFAELGESNYTIQLCANCHEIYHILYSAIKHGKKRSLAVLGHVYAKNGPENRCLTWIHQKVLAYIDLSEWIDIVTARLNRDVKNLAERVANGETSSDIARDYSLETNGEVFTVSEEDIDKRVIAHYQAIAAGKSPPPPPAAVPDQPPDRSET